MTKKILLTFGLIILLASVLRLWGIGSTPPSPDWDEVALGYNAYSILHTGRDEYGKFLPVVLRSFDDYKPALYVYLVIPSILLFDVTTLAVRLPSAIAGIFTVIATFFLIRVLFKRNDLALLTSFLLAISPWHIQFSRIGFESNVGLFCNVLMALFFVTGLKRPWLLSLSAFFGALAIYTYQSEKVFTPLFVLLFIVVYFRELLKIGKKYLFTALLVGILTVLPTAVFMATDSAAFLRAKGTSIFNSPTVYLKDNALRVVEDRQKQNYLGLFLDNRRFVYAREVIGGYISHYNISFLIFGDIGRHHAPFMGLVYLIEIPFILLGIYLLLFGKFDRKAKLIVFGWFLLAPVPASITVNVPHAVRTLNFLPTFQVFIAIGLIYAYVAFMKYKFQAKMLNMLKRPVIVGFFTLAIFNFVYYLNQYFVQQNYFYAAEWQYGYEKLVPIAESLKKNYKKVLVSDTQPMDKSYIFFLFYLKYPPEQYQIIGKNASGHYTAEHHFDKYIFRPIHWEVDSLEKDVLFIGLPKEFPGSLHESRIERIYNPDGSVAIQIVK